MSFSWCKYEDAGFSIEYPPLWSPQADARPGTLVVKSLDRTAAVLVQQVDESLSVGGAQEILEQLRFPEARMYASPIASAVLPTGPGQAARQMFFRMPSGDIGTVQLRCTVRSGQATVVGYSARSGMFAEMAPFLEKIVNTLRLKGPASQAVPLPSPRMSHITYVTWTDPQGAFSTEVPQEWETRGALLHPYLGDRRCVIQTQSPEGIIVMLGDPECPQSFCQSGIGEGQMLSYPQGTVFLNLPPSSKKLANWYMNEIAPRRFGKLQIGVQKERKSYAGWIREVGQKRGTPLPASMDISGYDIEFQMGERMGVCFAACLCNRAMSLGMMTLWEGNVLLWIAPPALLATAEQVAWRVAESFKPLQKFYQAYQQDEAIIASNGMVASVNQQQWFAGQQAVAATQRSFGDAIVNSYWQRQQATDSITQHYWDTQRVNDQASQNWSDTMLGNQRLYDGTTGKNYDVSSGSKYYWLDQSSGQIVGTETDNPPNLLQNYTQLKKL